MVYTQSMLIMIDESIRSPAIRLVTNKLYNPITQDAISLTIENFATSMLLSLKTEGKPDDDDDKESSTLDFDIFEKEYVAKESDIPEEEAKRRIFLYFSLCTKKHELLSG